MRPLLFAVALATLPVLLLGQSPPSADALARSLQERYDRVRDFSADFTQTYRGGVLRTETRERGTVAIKKPGRMRWVYTNPERKEFVSDGQKLYSYIPEDRQVIVSRLPSEDRATTSALFLAGRGNIARDFTAAYTDTFLDGTLALKLTPRSADPDYEFLVVAVDPGTLQIRGIRSRDRQGGESTLVFSNLKENQQIPDKQFEFRVPRGTSVITDDSPS